MKWSWRAMQNVGLLWKLENTGTYLIMGSTTQTNLGRCVVFVLSAEFHGTSMNTALLSGPDMQKPIAGVLLRFREKQIVVNGYIEAIYHQVKVPENQRCFLWFLWWKDSDSSNVIVDHEMTAHVSGDKSLSSCSNSALKKTAADNV